VKEVHIREVDEKVERVVRLAAETGVKGILLASQPAFSWLTGGRTNRIDGSRETGAGALLITADGRRYIVANNIESPRLAQEAVVDLDFETVAFPWTDERSDPALPFRTAARVAGAPIGSDTGSAEAVLMDARIARLRAPLVRDEAARYRRLGSDAGRIVGDVLPQLQPGLTERHAAGAVGAALTAAGIRPIVLLAAADHRIARFRHPVPTELRWSERLLVGTCCERDGLIVALSRLISTRDDQDVSRRTHAAASAFAAAVGATTPSATGARLFDAIATSYASSGYPGEEAHHHQGGAIGYRAREWVAHPTSTEAVALPQAFAWNPTVAGTKVEETCLVHEDGQVEMITGSPNWPSIRFEVRGQSVELSDIYRI
jgi:Xaa-Pro aminopeptidase